MKRIPGLDALRGLAIIAVVLFHVDERLGPASGVISRVYHEVARLGWIGVDLFFVLSGFLITGILCDTKGSPGFLKTFYLRRALRIFPVYYAFLAFFYGLGPLLLIATRHPAAIQSRIQPSTQLFAWAYVMNWFMGMRHLTYFPESIGHFWSLAVEEQFYLFWPLLVLLLSRPALNRTCFGLMVTAIASRFVLHYNGFGGAAYTWTICRLDGFAAGGLVAIAARDRCDWNALCRPMKYVAPACGLWFVILAEASTRLSVAYFWFGVVGNTLLAVFFAGGVIAVANPVLNPVRWIDSSRALHAAGKYSYAAYVWHLPIIVLLGALNFRAATLTSRLHLAHGGGVLALLIVNAVPIACTAIVALASWHLIERPLLAWKEHSAFRGSVSTTVLA